MHQSSSFQIDYASALNERQLRAVTVPAGPILVIAGAGSGKTRTIVYRVAWLVEQGIDPDSILLLTFTRKASQEMLTRAAELLDQRVTRVSGGTFHSTGNALLRRYATLLGFESSFSIMDQGDTHEALDHLRKTVMEPPADPKSFPKTRTMAEILGRAVGGQGSIEEVIRARYPHFAHCAGYLGRLQEQYSAYKRANHLMDYDDLLVHTVTLLEEHEQVRAAVSERWQHVLVDEYQDTNPLQARIVRLLAYSHDNVMVVGDDSQSIYSFRGADFTNIMEFPNLFPGTTIVKLEENYRSTAPILKVTNTIIAQATTGYPKTLFTQKTEGPLPLLARAESERNQSRFVLKCIMELVEHGVLLSDIAVLFRAGYHSFDLEGELHRNDIPFVKHGGFKFLESQHIKDVLSHLKVINNPSDRMAWIRTLSLLPGVGAKTAATLAGRIAEEGLPRTPGELVSRKKKYAQEFYALMDLLAQLREKQMPLADKVDLVKVYYAPYLQEKFDNHPKRMRDLDQLVNMTVSYTSLNRFLNDMALEPPDTDTDGEESTSDNLVLSTIHSSKGLEWHTVILIWAAEGRIPSPSALDSPEDMEEERRLLYVATTRAKHNLVVVAPETALDRVRGTVRVSLSRFVAELPPDYFRFYRD